MPRERVSWRTVGQVHAPKDHVTVATVRFWPFALPDVADTISIPAPSDHRGEPAQRFRRWVRRAVPLPAGIGKPSPAALSVFKAVGITEEPGSALHLMLVWDSEAHVAEAHVQLSLASLRATGEIMRPTPTLHRLFWHFFRQKDAEQPRRASDVCGFFACGGACLSVHAEGIRRSFHLNRVFEKVTRDYEFANTSQVTFPVHGAREESPTDSHSSDIMHDSSGSVANMLATLPDECLLKITSHLQPHSCRELSKTCVRVSDFIQAIVPGLKLKLFPHQVRALTRMLATEAHTGKDLSVPMLHQLNLKGMSLAIVVVDMVDGAVLRLERMPYMRPLQGGLFCDEPGLGKTITALALVLGSPWQLPKPPDGVSVSTAYRRHIPKGIKRYKLVIDGRYRAFGDDCQTRFRSRRTLLLPASRDILRRSLDRPVKRPDFFETGKGEGSVPMVEGKGDVSVYLSHATLIVVPDVLIQHWTHQLDLHVESGKLRVLEIKRATDLSISASVLSSNYDVVLATFEAIESLHNAMRREPPTLMRVHFLRLIVDEGHNLSSGNLSNFGYACERLRAERRWIMTGTPSPSTPRSDVDHLQYLLKFLREESYGLDKAAWVAGIRDPYSSYRTEGLERLNSLLGRVMIRASKTLLNSKCHVSDIILDFTKESADSYNWLVSLARRNLVTADWYSQEHAESLLNRKNLSEARETVRNLRSACCYGRTLDVIFVRSEVISTLDTLYDRHREKAQIHPNARFDDPTADWPLLLQNGFAIAEQQAEFKSRVDLLKRLRESCTPFSRFSAPVDSKDPKGGIRTRIYSGILHSVGQSFLSRQCECSCCGKFTRIPMVTPCAHLLCDECVTKDKTKCVANTCGSPYSVKKGIPEDLIELQPGAISHWRSDWLESQSAKTNYLVEKINSLPMREDWVHGEKNPRQTPPKILVHSQFSSNLMFVAIALKRDPNLKEAYVEMCVNEQEYDKELRNVTKASEYAVRSVRRFVSDPAKRILLMDTKHGAVGFDLSCVKYIFLLEPVWDSAVELQIISRAHRIGSEQDIFVERLVMRDTVEHEMVNRLNSVMADARETNLAAQPENLFSGLAADKAEEEFCRVKTILLNLKPAAFLKEESKITVTADRTRSLCSKKRKHDEYPERQSRRVRFRPPTAGTDK